MFEIKNPKNGSILQVAEFDFHSEMNFHDAKNACNILGNDWRLPTIAEAELIYKMLHLKGKGNFDRKGIYQWFGSYWCEKDGYGFSQVFSFKDGSVNGNAEANNGYVRVVRNFREKDVTDTKKIDENSIHNISIEYVKKLTDKFSKTVEYRMKESVILNNNKGLPSNYKFDLNIRVFVENNDFMNSKIVLVLTYYAPQPGTGTILHESVADVLINNKDVFKLNNEYSYSGLDSYYKLEVYNEILGQKSSRTEQVQFNIDLATLLKIVNAKTFEIKFNKKSDYSGKISNMISFIGFYNKIFDSDFKKEDLINVKTNLSKENDVERKKYELQITTPPPNSKFNQKKKTDTNTNCFIITATMNDPHHPIVEEFRAYRDRKLLSNIVGKTFVYCYYKVGPFVSLLISKSRILQKLSFKLFVNPVYKQIKND